MDADVLDDVTRKRKARRSDVVTYAPFAAQKLPLEPRAISRQTNPTPTA